MRAQKQRALIALQGEIFICERLKALRTSDDLVIGVDGGSEHLFALNWPLDRLIGDLDSISADTFKAIKGDAVPVEKHESDKDYSDFELALKYAIKQEIKEVVVIGAFGGRPDHALFNLFCVLNDEFKDLYFSMFDGQSWVHILQAEAERVAARELLKEDGKVLSLLPLTNQVLNVSLSGAKWPLKDKTLKLGSTLSLSNEITEAKASLSIKKGVLASFQTAS